MNSEENNSKHQNHLNYAYIITCMETYLFKAMIDTMDSNKQCYINLAKNVNNSAKLSTIYKNSLEYFIKKEVLGNFQFHNMSQVKIYYKNTFDIDLPSNMITIFKAVEKRHDIVHRCGYSKDGEPVNILFEDVVELKEKVTELIRHIDMQLKSKFYT